jgi:hypothetical protein
MPDVLVWDIETVPDLRGYAAAYGLDGKTDEEIRGALGDKFPKHIYHSLVCIGALIVHQDNDHWVVDALGAPHVGERSERELIAAFVERIAELNPQLVTFNGSAFDLPVLRYRAMKHSIAAPGLSARPDTPTMLLTSVTFCPRLRRRPNQRCMSCVVYWDCPANPSISMVAKSRNIFGRAEFRTSPITVRAMS